MRALVLLILAVLGSCGHSVLSSDDAPDLALHCDTPAGQACATLSNDPSPECSQVYPVPDGGTARGSYCTMNCGIYPMCQAVYSTTGHDAGATWITFCRNCGLGYVCTTDQ